MLEGLHVLNAGQTVNCAFELWGTESGRVKIRDISGLSSCVKAFQVSSLLNVTNHEKVSRVLLHSLRICGCDGIPPGLKTCIPCPSGRIAPAYVISSTLLNKALSVDTLYIYTHDTISKFYRVLHDSLHIRSLSG
jgi:hypothetical protein